MRFIGIIPARMESTRFPGKPLAIINGFPMLWHVCKNVAQSKSIYPYYVATSNAEIIDECREWKTGYIITRPDCRSGTERCADAMRQLSNREGDVVINVQGDEPMIRPESLDALALAFNDPAVEIASLYFMPSNCDGFSDRNRVKVLVGESLDALAFTRTTTAPQLWKLYGRHVGVYAYRREILNKIANLPAVNDLEQIAWMRAGYAIRMVEIPYETVAVDAPEDIAEVERKIE